MQVSRVSRRTARCTVYKSSRRSLPSLMVLSSAFATQLTWITVPGVWHQIWKTFRNFFSRASLFFDKHALPATFLVFLRSPVPFCATMPSLAESASCATKCSPIVSVEICLPPDMEKSLRPLRNGCQSKLFHNRSCEGKDLGTHGNIRDGQVAKAPFALRSRWETEALERPQGSNSPKTKFSIRSQGTLSPPASIVEASSTIEALQCVFFRVDFQASTPKTFTAIIHHAGVSRDSANNITSSEQAKPVDKLKPSHQWFRKRTRVTRSRPRAW